MPSRNVYKPDVADAYYHVYARGASKQKIFLEARDYKYFLSLFERYLASQTKVSKSGFVYPNYRGAVELLAYCLMQNHFHLLIYQIDQGAMSLLMRSVMTSYSRYFNGKYQRSGALFETRYKAAIIDRDNYLQHISRYIHLNPRAWEKYRYSSIGYYTGIHTKAPEWLTISKVAEIFDGADDYKSFVSDHEASMRMLDELKHQLADR